MAGVTAALTIGSQSQVEAQTIVYPGNPMGSPYVTGTNLNFPISGLSIGTSYIVTIRTNLNYSPVEWWQPITNRGSGFPSSGGAGYRWGFTADKTNGTYTIPLPKDKTGFYVLWNLDNYCGTTPQILSPTNNATVSGTVIISGGVMDFFEVGFIALWIDGVDSQNLYWGQTYNGDGTANLTLDTTSLSNGRHTIYEEFGMNIPGTYPWDPPTPYIENAVISIYVTNNLILKIDKYITNGDNLDFYISGMKPTVGYKDPVNGYNFPGHQYMLVRVDTLNPGPINYLEPVMVAGDGQTSQYVFTPTNSSGVWQASMPTNSSVFSYSVLDYTTYANPPTPYMITPKDNTAVGGIVQFQAGMTDIFPVDHEELFIDGTSYGIATNGTWSIDTALLPNGPHSVDMLFFSLFPTIDDSGQPNQGCWPSDAMLYNLQTTNPLAENVAPRNFTAEFGTVPFAFDTLAPAVVNVDIYDSTGTNLVWNTSVTNNAVGTCYPSWNLKDNGGNPVPLPGSNYSVTYQVVVSATPLTPNASLPSAKSNAAGSDNSMRTFPITLQSDPYAGHTAVFRGNHPFLLDFLNTQEETELDGTMGAVFTAYPIYPSDPSGYDRGMNKNCSPYVIVYNQDAPFFYNVLTNQGTGQFQFVCDANTDVFGCSGELPGKYTATYIFHGKDVADALGTTLNNDPTVGDTYGHRVRLANIEGCFSAAGKLNRDFGEPDINRPGMSQASFVGWIIYGMGNPFGPSVASPTGMVAEYWWSYWTNEGFDGGPGVLDANAQCLSEIPVIIPNPWRSTANFQWGRIFGIKGSKNMPWQKKD